MIPSRFNIIIFSFFTLLAGCTSDTDKENQKAAFKNVIFIVADDHARKAMGRYGHPLIETPNLDRMADQGINFTRAYCTAPICSASRQSMLTGKYPHATGVSLLFTPFQDKGNVTIAEHLQQNGFQTALIGKQHFNNWIWWSMYPDGLPDHGFDVLIDRKEHRNFLKEFPPQPIPDSIITRESYPEKNPNSIWNTDYLPSPCYDKDCSGTYLTERAIEFIEENQDDRFMLWLAYHEPHAPFDFPIEYADKVHPDSITLPMGSPEDDRWIPEIFANLNEKEIRGAIAAYLTSTMYMDRNVGRVLQVVSDLGLDENTLVIYASDNGYLLYDHKRLEKHTMWEESAGVPLIVKGHGIEPAEAGELISYADLVPTTLEALAVDPIPDVQGRSFFPLLNQEPYVAREYAFSEFLEDNMAMIATQNWKYVFTTGKRDLGLEYKTGHGAPDITHLLYDLQNDPGETTNLADSEYHQEQLNKMQELMLQHFMDTHPDANNVPDLTRVGKLVWFCEPRDVGSEYGGVPLRVKE